MRGGLWGGWGDFSVTVVFEVFPNLMWSSHKRSFWYILTDIQCWLFKGLSKWADILCQYMWILILPNVLLCFAFPLHCEYHTWPTGNVGNWFCSQGDCQPSKIVKLASNGLPLLLARDENAPVDVAISKFTKVLWTFCPPILSVLFLIDPLPNLYNKM